MSKPTDPIERIRGVLAEWRRGCSVAGQETPEECPACTKGALDAIADLVEGVQPNLTLAVVQRRWKEEQERNEDLAVRNHELHTKWTETSDALDRLRHELKAALGGAPSYEASDEELIARVGRAVEAEGTLGALESRLKELESENSVLRHRYAGAIGLISYLSPSLNDDREELCALMLQAGRDWCQMSGFTCRMVGQKLVLEPPKPAEE